MLRQVTEASAECAEARTWAMSDTDLVTFLDTVHAAQTRLAAAGAHAMREITARRLPAAAGTANPAVWLRDRLRISNHTARTSVTLAAALDDQPALDAAVGAGTVTPEQANIIHAAVAALPESVGAQVRTDALTRLIEFAGQFEPAALRKLGARILTVVAPEVAERAEAEALARQEARARIKRALCLTPTGEGRVRVTGWLDTEAAAIVRAALDPLCTPTAGDTRSATQRRADALVDICAMTLRSDLLPTTGGDSAHMVVTMPFTWLREQVGVATLDTGEHLSPQQARRVACDAGITPVVLDGDSQVLDLGRTRRLVSAALRRALVVRDGGCCFPGCDRPARWCQAHHVVAWVDGGDTTLTNLALTCGFHHRLVHHDGWEIRIGTDGHPEWIPHPT